MFSKLNFCLIVALLHGSVAAQGPPERPPSPVVVSPVVRATVASGQSFVGSVEPLRTAVIGSAVAGRVSEYSLTVGDRVEAGGTLAQLLTNTINLELAAAEADLDLRTQELLELETGSLAEEVEQAEARMLSAQAQKKYLEERDKRLQSLSGASAREEREQAAAAASTAIQELREATAAHALAVKGPRKERIAQARARVATQQANVDLLKDRIRKYTIVTRFKGYVTKEHTELGEWLQVGEPVAEVAALDEVEIVAQVVENHVPFVHLGMTVRVEIPSLASQMFTGIVSSVAPQGDFRSRTFPIRIRVTNVITEDGPTIKSGMFARVTLPTGSKQDALLTSKDAIVLGGPQPLVFTIATQDKQTVAMPVPIQLGVAAGELIQIIGDIDPDAKIITLGNERVRPGQPVAVTKEVKLQLIESNSEPRATKPPQTAELSDGDAPAPATTAP